MANENNLMQHGIVCENRHVFTASAVEEVESFDEKLVVMRTSMGRLTVKGSSFQITRLSLESGDICVEGEIDSILYSQSHRRKDESLMKRIFG